jgi:hypothetical protein
MAKKHQLKPTTLDDLAAIINQGFTETQRYLDQRLDGMKDVLTDVVQELNATYKDVRYIRTTMNLLVRNDVAQDAAIKTLSARVARLQRCTRESTDSTVRDTLADEFLMACDEASLSGEQAGEAETSIQALIIAEALAGFLTLGGCRYGNLDVDVDRAQAALVTALGGVVHEPGVYAVPVGTPITAAAIAHLIGWVTALDVEEGPLC